MTQADFELHDWHRINEHLDRALDLEPHARARWLEQLASVQPGLARTIRSLLAELDSQKDDDFLERPPVELAAVFQAATMIGQRVGAYTIERLLGRGGMGDVWLASRSDGRFEAQCAIKFLSAPAAHSRLAERFQHEARLLARLGHPHIARLLDAGTTADGRQFLVLEYVPGLHIDEYCEQNELSVQARVRLFLDAVAAVAHAHSLLVVHRDLKPSNVLVTHDGTVKLLDFGIAKLLDDDDRKPADGRVTRVEEIAVTPEYAAPEQLLGDMTSTATDVYQLGMLLYQLLARDHPLKLSGSRAERIKAALSEKLPRASEFAAAEHRKQLRGDLDAILAKALHPTPAQRYPTAAALREDLVSYLNREPISARSKVGLYTVGKFITRHRVAAVISAVSLTSLCGMLIFALGEAHRADSERDRALQLVSRNEAYTDFLGMLISEAAEAEKPVTVTEMLARSEKLARTDIRDSPENHAAIMEMLGELYGTLGEYPTSIRLFDNGLAMLANSPDHSLRSKLTCLRAESIAYRGQGEEAVRIIESELTHLESDQRVAAYCMLYLSNITGLENSGEPAMKYAKQALARFQTDPTIRRNDEGMFLDAMAWAYHLHGQNIDADRYYRQAVQKFAEFGREASAPAIVARNNWGVVVDCGGAPKLAFAIHDQALSLLTRSDRGPPGYLLGNRAKALEAIGRYPEAHAAFEVELQVAQKQKSEVTQAHALYGLFVTSQELHDRQGAADYLARFTELMRPGTLTHPLARQWYGIAQARLELDAGQFMAARARFSENLGNPNTAYGMAARLGKSEADLRAGDTQAAEEDARIALETARTMQGDFSYSNYTGLSWLALARAQEKRGDGVAARKSLENAELQLSNTVDDQHQGLVEVRSLLAKG